MRTRALEEARLHRFLRRRRRLEGVDPPPFAPALSEPLDLAARLLPAASGALYLDEAAVRERGDPTLTCVACFGPAVGLGATVPRDESVVARAYRSGRALHEGRALAIPVQLERAVCGVLLLRARRGRRFGAHDAEIAELLAAYLARSVLVSVDVLKQHEWAVRDELTGTRSARAIEPELERAIHRAERAGSDVAVLFIDVDRLKRLNDSLGHRAGSEALRRVGEALSGAVHERGDVFRFGGDEFVVVLPGHGGAAALDVANALRSAVLKHTAGPFEDDALPPLTASVGVATLRTSGASDTGTARVRAARLLSAADDALYRAKDAGRNAAVLATARPRT